MSPANSNPDHTPKQALLNLRIMWAGFLFGQLAFFAVITIVFVLPEVETEPVDRTVEDLMFAIAWGLMAVSSVIAYVFRGILYKQSRRNHGVVSPSAYFSGNIVILAVLEGTSLFGLVTVLLAETFWPYLLPSAIAFVWQLVLFPKGDVMKEDPFAALDARSRERV